MEEVNYKNEVESLIKPEVTFTKKEPKIFEDDIPTGKVEEDIKIEFIDEYEKLCKKYGMTFVQGQIKVVKI